MKSYGNWVGGCTLTGRTPLAVAPFQEPLLERFLEYIVPEGLALPKRVERRHQPLGRQHLLHRVGLDQRKSQLKEAFRP